MRELSSITKKSLSEHGTFGNAAPSNHVPVAIASEAQLTLPSPVPSAEARFVWGEHSSAEFVRLIEEAYCETIHWRKKYFHVPLGSSGKAFVSELARLFRAYAENSTLEIIALKAVSVACILLLQQPHLKSKSRVNATHLIRRLKLWKDGKIDELLFEGRSIQQRLHIANRSHTAKRSPDKDSRLARSFANLMFQGKTKDAIRLITENNRGRILLPDDVLSPGTPDSPTVFEALKSKHLPAQPRVDDAISSR